jgi:predicted transcriptional regulator
MLARDEQIRRIRDKNRLRLFPWDVAVDRSKLVLDWAADICAELRHDSYIAHRDLAQELDVPVTTLDFQMARLVRMGVVEVTRRNRERFYRLLQAP